jgi:hypothetical protein
MSEMLEHHAPSLRALFAGLSQLSYERSRVNPPALPRPGKNRRVKREDAEWVVVPGHLSFAYWTSLLDALALRGVDPRNRRLCFIYSIMAVVDGCAPPPHPTPATPNARHTQHPPPPTPAKPNTRRARADLPLADWNRREPACADLS